MKNLIFLGLIVAGSMEFCVVVEAKSFSCSNAPAVNWGQYFCLSASYVDSLEIKDVTFGVCEGSSKAEEEEPVNTVEIKSAKNNPSIAATSAEWKDASAFDLSSKEIGLAHLYIKQDTFLGKDQERSIVRLKVKENGAASFKEVRLSCGGFQK